MSDASQKFVEEVAKAVALTHFSRGARNPKPDRIDGLVDRHWREFVNDAVFIIEIINGCVQVEAICDAIAAPETPGFVRGLVN